MAPAPASFFLATYYSFTLLILLPHLATSCSIYTFVCEKSENSSTIRACGRSRIRCDNGLVQFQFFGTGPWYPATSIEYPESTIKIWDTNATLVSRLKSTHCDFFYNFSSKPIPGFHPSWIEGLVTNSTFFDCSPYSHDFSRDVFGRLIGPHECVDYDLHYTSGTMKPPPNDPCSPNKTGVVEMELTFHDNGGYVDFSLRSIGFSRLRALDADCFSCATT